MGLKEKTASSIKWNTVATVIVMVVQVLQLAILTRLLERSDFGIIAIATLVISFTDIFSELGITAALIHKQDITHEVYSSVYWLNVFMSICVFLVTISLSPLVASFYHEPRLKLIISLLAIKILFGGIGKMFQTIKIKNLEFKFISIVRIVSAILGLLVSTGLAIWGLGVLSLVFGQLINVGVNQIIFAIAGLRKERVLFHFSFKEVKDVLTIGGFQLGTHILDFVASRLDIFLIGRFFSMDELGLYNIAKDLITKPFVVINSISSNVFSSAFSKIQSNIESVILNFSKLIKTISLLSIPLYIGIFAFADLIVSVLYAPDFSEVARFIRILTMVGIFSSLTSQGGPLMIAKGRTDLGLRWTIIRIIVNSIILITTASLGVYWVAYGQSFLSFILYFIYFLMVIRPLLNNKYPLREYITTPLRVFIPVLMIAAPIICVNLCFDIHIVWQIILLLAYVVVYYIYVRKKHYDMLIEYMRIMMPSLKK